MSPSNPLPITDLIPHVLLDEFLAPEELWKLQQRVIGRRDDFTPAQVINDGDGYAHVDQARRRSLVMMGQGMPNAVVRHRVVALLPWLLDQLGMAPFAPGVIETQITASGHGDFFALHRDNHSAHHEGRAVTGVLFCHLDPPAFRGGELILHASHSAVADGMDGLATVAVEPRTNTAVFFPSHLPHEVTRLVSPTPEFAASRFTMTIWVTPAPARSSAVPETSPAAWASR